MKKKTKFKLLELVLITFAVLTHQEGRPLLNVGVGDLDHDLRVVGHHSVRAEPKLKTDGTVGSARVTHTMEKLVEPLVRLNDKSHA